jgi:putative transposase
MARLPRLVLPGYPYHVTQRGHRRQQTFSEDGDYELYRDLLAEAARKAGAEIWAHCPVEIEEQLPDSERIRAEVLHRDQERPAIAC